MIDFYNEILEIFKKNSDILYGISNIEDREYKLNYKCSLVIAVPHSELLSIKNYNEEKFENLIGEASECIKLLLEEITAILIKYKIHYYIIPTSPNNGQKIIKPYSFKFASVNAGIGWIGKNDVLITERYGPRVRLSAILIDYDLPKGNPITQSKCPSECDICVKACPYNALTGKAWDINTKREELINYQLCNAKRSLYIKTHNRKNSCGLCMVSCPVGLSALPTKTI